MRTQFAPSQLSDFRLADAEANLRACMHCGICTATCPTYVLLGDERDGPRGRIVMMQRMLEEDGAPSAETVLHVDRCLSCLACRTACPSGVDYARLVDLARAHIETHFHRPLRERIFRWLIEAIMSRASHVRVGLKVARIFAPFLAHVPGKIGAIGRKGASVVPCAAPSKLIAAQPDAPHVAIVSGCVQAAVAPEIDLALSRTLKRAGHAPIYLDGCCGSLAHHLGQPEKARAWAMRTIEAYERTSRDRRIEFVVISATGCAAHLKDYAYLFKGDAAWEARAKKFASMVRDVSEVGADGSTHAPIPLRVAFHSACSAQNGLGLKGQVEALLADAGFEVIAVPEGHLCCGSAGSYSLLQPDIAGALRSRKLANIAATAPDVVATGNIGCHLHLKGPDAPPLVHYVELLDWAQGGPVPQALRAAVDAMERAR